MSYLSNKFALLLLLSTAVALGTTAFSAPPFSATVQSIVAQRIQSDKKADVMVYFSASPDFRFATQMENRVQRVQFVYGALKQSAETSQKALIALLKSRNVQFRPFSSRTRSWFRTRTRIC